jgi:hypothetical protein
MRHSFAILFALAVTGCATSSTGDPDAQSSAEADSGLPLPVGAFHRDDTTDAVNLELRADGSWRMASDGCDTKGAASGQTVRQGDAWRLVVAENCSIRWTVDEYSSQNVDELRIVDGEQRPGRLFVSGVRADDSTFSHELLPGGLCPNCASMGPSSFYECDFRFDAASEWAGSDCD